MGTFIFTAFCISLLYSEAMGITVHYYSVGRTILGAGVFRVVVDIDTLLASPESGASNHSSDFVCVTLGPSTQDNINALSLSYDAPAKRTLLQLEWNYRMSESTAISDETCTPQEHCNYYGTEDSTPGRINIMNSQSTTDNGYIGPMASWNGTIYFVYTPDTDTSVDLTYKPFLQLRKVNHGYIFPVDGYDKPLKVDSFSTVLANLSTGESRRWLQAGGFTLLVVPTDEGELVFLTLTRAALYLDPPRETKDIIEFGYALFAVYPVAEDRGYAAKVLHLTRDLSRRWYHYQRNDYCGVSYMDGMLCWSPLNDLICAKWTPEQAERIPSDMQSVVPPGQALVVCQGFNDTGLVNLTTGVAIVETPKNGSRLALIYSCYARNSGHGGMGLLVKDVAKNTTEVRRVTYKGEPLTSGTMFITPDNLCDHYIREDQRSDREISNTGQALAGTLLMCLPMLVVIAGLL